MISFAFLFCLVMFIISMCYSNVFVAMFTNDAMTMPIADRAIKIFCLGILMMSIQYVLVDGITGLSNVFGLHMFIACFFRGFKYFLCTTHSGYLCKYCDNHLFYKNHTFLFKKSWCTIRSGDDYVV